MTFRRHQCLVLILTILISISISISQTATKPTITDILNCNYQKSIGDSVRFSTIVSGTIPFTYKWLKNGSDSVGNKAELFFPAIMDYNAGAYSCIVRNSSGADTSVPCSLLVDVPPLADFSISSKKGYAPFTVQFTDKSQGIITNRTWYFGDSQTDSNINPSHTYQQSGYYSVKLAVYGLKGNSILEKTDSIQVIPNSSSQAETNTGTITDSAGGVKVNAIRFDEKKNGIFVAWKVDSLLHAKSIYVTCVPKKVSNPWYTRIYSSDISSLNDSTTILLGNKILFDTTYIVSLWAKNDQGDSFFPDSTARATVLSGPINWQPVSYFEVDDSVRAFNSNVLLWKDQTYTIGVTLDTIIPYTMNSNFKGFIPASQGFSFKSPQPSPSFYVGFRLVKLPQNISINKVKIYRDSAGYAVLDTSSKVDSINQLVWAKISDLEHPFIAMVDTQVAKVNFLSDTGKIIETGKTIFDTVVITDNCINGSWQFAYSKGNELPILHSDGSGSTKTGNDTLILSIPSSEKVVTEDYGVRSTFTTSIGPDRSVHNISRRVTRPVSEEIPLSIMKWAPISLTAKLTQSAPESVFTSKTSTENWTYNETKIRLYRWEPLSTGATIGYSWIQYSPELSSSFNFEPGKLFWIKSREAGKLSFGEGTTLSLKDTFTISLAPDNWNDIAIPYRFNINLNNILKATGSNADTLQFYNWINDIESGTYVSKGVFVNGISDLSDRDIVIEGGSSGLYTIYNPLDKEMVLRIPPIPSTTTTTPISKRTVTTQRGYSVKVSLVNSLGKSVQQIYCGVTGDDSKVKGDTANVFPCPISLEGVSAGIKGNSGTFGHILLNRRKDEGSCYALVFRNNSSTLKKYAVNIDALQSTPTAFNAVLADPLQNTKSAKGSVTLEPGQTAYRWLIVGSADYIDGIGNTMTTTKLALNKLITSPRSKLLKINYTIPYNPVGKIIFNLVDARGKTVLTKSVENETPGAHSLTLNLSSTHSSAGYYLLQMKTYEPKQGFITVHNSSCIMVQ